MLELDSNELRFSFPEIHESARCTIGFQRTLRIPDDNREYPLPAGLGHFPIEHVDDHAERIPTAWRSHGGVLLPMYQAEAMWISLGTGINFCEVDYPMAVKVAAGKICAITGRPWSDRLSTDLQDYLVIPGQRWLDGFCVQKGLIRQFVAMPLGAGYSAEEQITGTAENGGIQIIAYPMKRDHYERLVKRHRRHSGVMFSMAPLECSSPAMGLAAGGLMRQEIYEDEYGIDAWETTTSARCFVHILNSEQWHRATGHPAPDTPVTADAYAAAAIPWFDYYDDRRTALNASSTLAQLDSVESISIKKGNKPSSETVTIENGDIVNLSPKKTVTDGSW